MIRLFVCLDLTVRVGPVPFFLCICDVRVGPVPLFLCVCVDIHYFCLVFVTIPPYFLSLSVSHKDENIAEGYPTRTKQAIRSLS